MAHNAIRPSDVFRAIVEHPWRLVGPAAIVTLLAASYAVCRPATWEASQALVVRNEAGDGLSRPGKFSHTDEMKTVQETILELANSRSVLAKALADVGPPIARGSARVWPGETDIEALQSNVKVTPPKGAEFGKTEVFYLKVRDNDHQRAIELAGAICRQVQNRYDALREAKAKSTTNELASSVKLSQADLAEATGALQNMEQCVGSDLAELRILTESPSGDSNLRRNMTDLERELRAFRAAYDENQAHLKLLTAAEESPNVLAIPSALVKAQPALGRLKDGLVDAQLRTGALLGPMLEGHPLVANARGAEDAIRQQLHDEIEAAKKGVEVDLLVNAEHIASLEAQHAEVQGRLERLASVRAEYANLVAAAKSRTENLKAVEHELSEVRASGAAAHAGSLITPLDTPFAGTTPMGPGRVSILLGGAGLGLALGLALVFLTLTPSAPPLQVRSAPASTLKQALNRVNGPFNAASF